MPRTLSHRVSQGPMQLTLIPIVVVVVRLGKRLESDPRVGFPR